MEVRVGVRVRVGAVSTRATHRHRRARLPRPLSPPSCPRVRWLSPTRAATSMGPPPAAGRGRVAAAPGRAPHRAAPGWVRVRFRVRVRVRVRLRVRLSVSVRVRIGVRVRARASVRVRARRRAAPP